MATYTSNYAWTKPSGGDPVDIEVLNDNLDDQDSIVHQAFLDLAPVFSTANTYAVKDVVLYDNKVWICHTAVTTAGAWTGSTNWTQTTVGETGGVGTYADLPDKPSINGNQLSGNKTGAQLGLQNTLTFDNVPTANSNNPVKSGGVYASDEAIRKWTTAEAKSVSGNPITLTDGSARNAEGLVVTLEPIQSGSGTPSPTNVRPITGYTECVVDRDGKNLLPLLATTRTVEGITYTVNDGIVTMNNTATGLSYLVLTNATNNLNDLSNVLIKAGTTIIASTGIDGKGLVARYTDGSYINLSSGSEFTPEKDIALVYIQYGSGTALNNVKLYPMIRLASVSDATFVPYSHYTATITFGQTVYGGNINFKTGKVTVTHKLETLVGDEGENWNFATGIAYRLFPEALTYQTPKANYFKGRYNTTYGNLQNGECAFAGQKNVNFRFDEATSKAEFVAYLSTHPLQFYYELETPIELTLTPAELELLKGYNYISTNGTTIALAYLPDSLLAEAENYVDAKIPSAPSSDGTYVLTCTVASGTPAYTWESAT